VGSLGAFRMLMYFDDEEDSDTYAEQVTTCPGCGLWLHALAIQPSHLAPQRRKRKVMRCPRS
jgi:hypothetical protein